MEVRALSVGSELVQFARNTSFLSSAELIICNERLSNFLARLGSFRRAVLHVANILKP